MSAVPEDLFVRVASLSDTGRVRNANEDAYEVIDPADPGVRARRGMLVVVADGMGGALGGATASRLTVEAVASAYYADDAPEAIPEALVHAVELANRAVYDAAQANPDLSGMGSTCTVAVVCGGQAWIAHVGDSRAYLVQGGEIRRLTSDHTHVGELVRRGVLTTEMAAKHPSRGVLVRCVGTRPQVKVDVSEAPVPLADQDRLVLCSDGLTGMASDAEILAKVQDVRPDTAVASLVDLANGRGGSDNITVHVVAMTRRSIVVSSTQMPALRLDGPPVKRINWLEVGLVLTAFALLGVLGGVVAWLVSG